MWFHQVILMWLMVIVIVNRIIVAYIYIYDLLWLSEIWFVQNPSSIPFWICRPKYIAHTLYSNQTWLAGNVPSKTYYNILKLHLQWDFRIYSHFLRHVWFPKGISTSWRRAPIFPPSASPKAPGRPPWRRSGGIEPWLLSHPKCYPLVNHRKTIGKLWENGGLPSGKRLHSELENHHL